MLDRHFLAHLVTQVMSPYREQGSSVSKAKFRRLQEGLPTVRTAELDCSGSEEQLLITKFRSVSLATFKCDSVH